MIGVAEPFDVVEEGEKGGAAGLEGTSGEQFAFARGEEALRHVVVVVLQLYVGDWSAVPTVRTLPMTHAPRHGS